jgi:hypothetical protein
MRSSDIERFPENDYMTRRHRCSLSLLACQISALFAQQIVPARPSVTRPGLTPRKASGDRGVEMLNTHERLIAVVPMVGAGTLEDPRRPQFAPPPRGKGEALSPAGIIGYSYQLTDDGNSAIVEFVARDRAAFQTIMADRTGAVKFFEKGKVNRQDLLTELQQHKRSVNLDQLGVRIP